MAVDVILRDGATLRLRAPVEGDVPGLVAFFAQLSVRSRFLRFHGFVVAGERFAGTLIEPDWAERGALVGVMGHGGEERIVAVGNYVRLRDPSTAEAAFAVADDYQRKGVGSRLLEQLARRAAAHGIEAFIAEVLAENQGMLSVFENIGFVPTRTLDERCRRGEVPDRGNRGIPGARRRARSRRRDGLAATVLRAQDDGRRRRLRAARLDRRAHLSQRSVGRVHGCGVPGQPLRRAGRRRARLPLPRGDRRCDRPLRDLPSGRARDRRRRGSAAGRDAGTLRDLGRVRRDGACRDRAAGAAARPRPRTWRAARRPELPRNRDGRRGHERDLRTAGVPRRPNRLLVSIRCARPRTARAGRGPRARPLRLRLDREQGRRVVQRPPRVVGGRPRHRPRPALPRVVRQPTQVRAHRPAARAARSPFSR